LFLGDTVKENNSVLITRVVQALFAVIGRRTLDSYAVQLLKTTIQKLEKKFDFLGFVTKREFKRRSILGLIR
jgi:hypothetical protein